MSPERWRRLKILYGQALDLPESERSRFVDGLSATDHDLLDDLRKLLARADLKSEFRFPLHAPPGINVDALSHVLMQGYELSGRYRIDAFLGSGGMGEVYQAFDLETSENIAVKVIRGELAAQPGFHRRLTRELSLARRIAHPNICKVFDRQRAAGPNGAEIVFLTMELLQGETLEARLRHGPLPQSEALGIAQQLIDGLQSAHSQGIVHRDLKDGNVMLVKGSGGGERAVITDFGLAREQEPSAAINASMATGEIIGTAAYMAPEQLEGKQVTIAADIYGLGVIFFKMVTGRLPFEGDTALAVALRRARSSAPSPRKLVKSVSRNWEEATLACLESRPEHRPRSAEEVGEILSGKLEPRSVTRRRWAIVAAIGAVCTVASGALWIGERPKPVKKTFGDEAVKQFRIGEDFAKRRNEESLLHAVEAYQAALQLEPEFLDAWAGLAIAFAVRANFTTGDTQGFLHKAQDAADRALGIDPQSPRALGTKGYCLSVDVDRWLDAEPFLRRAVELDPKSAGNRLWYGSYLGKAGNPRRAIEQIMKGLNEEPTSVALNQELAAEYLRVGDNEKALDEARQVVFLQPNEAISHMIEARAYEALGRFQEALSSCQEAAKYKNQPDIDAIRASILVGLGRRKDASRIAAQLHTLWNSRKFDSQLLAKLYVKLGDPNRAIEVLKMGIDRKEASLVGSILTPAFAPLFDRQDFVAQIRRIGFAPAMVKAYRK